MFQIQVGSDNPILQKKCKPVEKFDKNLQKIVAEMEETMLSYDAENNICGIGLAANQVGIDAQVFLITLNVGTKKDYRVLPMINPDILEFSQKKVWMEEGCLSLPGIFGKVLRPAKVRVRWQNLEGNSCERK